LIYLAISFIACLITIPICLFCWKEFEKVFGKAEGFLVLPMVYFSTVFAMLSAIALVFNLLLVLGAIKLQ
jgi:hypothetical protein